MRAIEREEMLELAERDQCGRPTLTAAEVARLDQLAKVARAEAAADERPGRPWLYGGDYSDL